ncbi:MAG: hypothetical protein JJV88_05135, partial [Sulfurovum sp.]|nr:hypothetical protein [Sulfurovaceae bacterium]
PKIKAIKESPVLVPAPAPVKKEIKAIIAKESKARLEIKRLMERDSISILRELTIEEKLLQEYYSKRK